MSCNQNRARRLANPIGLQRDIRAFFGSYANVCRLADELLFKAGDADAVDDACRRSAVGKLLPNALYVQSTAWSTGAAPIRRSSTARRPSCCPSTRSAPGSPGSARRRRSTACSPTRHPSGSATGGTRGWARRASACAGTAWFGGRARIQRSRSRERACWRTWSHDVASLHDRHPSALLVRASPTR